MGSQIPANLSKKKKAEVDERMRRFRPRSRLAQTQSDAVAATGIGTVAKTSAFVQCLSSRSVSEAMETLIGFSNKVNPEFTRSTPSEVFADYGVSAARPFASFSDEALRLIDEKLVAQQKATESAVAVREALPRAILDVLSQVRDRTPAEATQEEFHAAFSSVSQREIGSRLMAQVIWSLVSRTIDAAGSEISKQRQDEIKAKSRDFSTRLARHIDGLARKKGVNPADIPSQIPQWVHEIDPFVKRYRA